MIPEQKIRAIEYTAILLLWTLVVLSPLLFKDDLNQNWRAVHIMWAECSVVGFAFLANRFLLMPQLFFKRRYGYYVLSLSLLLLLLGLFVLYFDGVNLILSLCGLEQMENTIMGSVRPQAMPPQRMPINQFPPVNIPRAIAPPSKGVIPPTISVLVLSVIVIALDMGLSIAVKWIISEQKQEQMKRERVSVQLSNLQNQVSPHFFMNTLNNIHALVEIDPSRAQKTIIELSGLMDYLLYESSNQELVSLQREMEFTQSYIHLMQLRYPERVAITFSHDETIPPHQIPPLLFLNFIENTFKYGIDYTQRSFINIHFTFTPSHIVMQTINSNHSASVQSSRHGLGLSNSNKRLKLLYGDRFRLTINDQGEEYRVTLKIPIV